MLAEEVADAEPGQRLAAAVAEELCRRRWIDPALVEQRAENLHGPRPEWTEALLSALASQPSLERSNKLEVGGAQVEDFLHAGASVEEREQERVIAAAIRRCPIW